MTGRSFALLLAGLLLALAMAAMIGIVLLALGVL